MALDDCCDGTYCVVRISDIGDEMRNMRMCLGQGQQRRLAPAGYDNVCPGIGELPGCCAANTRRPTRDEYDFIVKLFHRVRGLLYGFELHEDVPMAQASKVRPQAS